MLIISIKDIPGAAQHDHAHSLLRVCLGKYGIDYRGAADLRIGRLGKPELAEYPGVFFNLTHCDGAAACVVSDRLCGIDAEKVRSLKPNVMRRAFSERECAAVERAPEKLKDLVFFRIWTLKESYVKALGTGISYPLKTAGFLPAGQEITTNITEFSFRQYIIDDPDGGVFVVSVCEKDR